MEYGVQIKYMCEAVEEWTRLMQQCGQHFQLFTADDLVTRQSTIDEAHLIMKIKA